MRRLLIFTALIGLLVNNAAAAENYGETSAYRNENTVQDKRRIGILAYGSLVNQPQNLDTGATLHTSSPFQPTQVKIPVSFSRLSSAGKPTRRITAVIDNQSPDSKMVYVATSFYQYLPNARNNLAAREGTSFSRTENKYDFANMCYMKKLLRTAQPDNNELRISDTNWVIRNETFDDHQDRARVQISDNLAKQVAKWAEQNDYSALIWASFPSNINSRTDVARSLLNDALLLQNTQAYVNNMPDGAQTGFERAIVANHAQSALQQFTR